MSDIFDLLNDDLPSRKPPPKGNSFLNALKRNNNKSKKVKVIILY